MSQHSTSEVSNESKTPVTKQNSRPTYRALRIWPAFLLIIAGLVLHRLPSLIENGPSNLWMSTAFGPALCGILVLVWWIAGSRATGKERSLGAIGILFIAAACIAVLHKTMLGPAISVMQIPFGMCGFAIGAVVCSRMLTFRRTIVALLFAAIGFAFPTLLRTDGMWGEFAMEVDWRWNQSAEEQLVAMKAAGRSATENAEPHGSEVDDAIANPEWPGFRGPDRLSRQTGVNFKSDWSTNPPEELWKIKVGPGWSSFVVAGNLLFTQEQRGEVEAVVCYDATTGDEVWIHETIARFDDPLGGPGPRSTPMLSDSGLFVLGGSGTLKRLDPRTGTEIWQTDLSKESGRSRPPMWGYSSSPLVVGFVVIVHAGGKGDKGILAFDIETGDLKWSAACGEMSYSSPQLSEIDGEELVLMLSETGIDMFDSASGENRFAYEWKHKGYRSLQPQVLADNNLILPTGMGTGTRRVKISLDKNQPPEELWTKKTLKPDFNDFVIFENHAYGFDNAIFTCVDLETGERKWKGGRYGKGQALLLEDSALILVISETGDLVLLDATPEKHAELSKKKVLDGKTWNHPVIVGDKLYLRNSKEAACFRLPIEDVRDSIEDKPGADA